MTDRERLHLIKEIQNAEPENGMFSVSKGAINEILDLLKEQETEKKCCRDCEYYSACHDE